MLMNRRPRILLLIPHLGGGGAERVMALLARGLSPDKYEVHLGVITQTPTDGAEISAWVAIHALGARRVRAGALPLLSLVRRLNPDMILSGMFHLSFLVLLLRPLFPCATRIVVRQNGTVSSALALDGLHWYTRPLYRLLYRRADRIICQTEAMAADLAGELDIAPDRLAVLPNPVDVDAIRDSFAPGPGLPDATAPHLLAVGRLSREKGFDLLLQAFVSVRSQFSGARLTIAGNGPEESELKSQCHQLGLDSVVRFPGHVPNPWQSFPDASLYVLSSRHEGLPNALLEAAAAGLPTVASPASGGLVDLLRGQPGVWLAPAASAEALAGTLLAALQALRPGERFAHPFVETFGMDRAISAYEGLIDAVLRGPRT
jgi:glycosyltransferase involved in cell wall biosynthesis